MVEDALCMLYVAGKQTRKRSCMPRLKEAGAYVQGIINFLPRAAGIFGMPRLAEVRACLREVVATLRLTAEEESWLSLKGLRLIQEEATIMLQEALQMLSDFVVADQEAGNWGSTSLTCAFFRNDLDFMRVGGRIQ
jgi:hypothetical protein